MTRPEELFSKVLGTAIIPDLSGFTDRVYSISSDERTALWSHLYQDCGLDKDQRSIMAKSVLNAFDSFFPKRTSGFFGPELAEKLYKFLHIIANDIFAPEIAVTAVSGNINDRLECGVYLQVSIIFFNWQFVPWVKQSLPKVKRSTSKIVFCEVTNIRRRFIQVFLEKIGDFIIMDSVGKLAGVKLRISIV